MARRGRPPVLDEKKQTAILAIVSVGCSQRAAARYVCCAPSTIRYTAGRDAQFAAQLERAKSSPEVVYLKCIHAAARKEQYWRAAAWALERMMPEKYARRGPDVITTEQIGVLMGQFAAIVVSEVPVAAYRKHILQRLDALCNALGVKLPKRKGRRRTKRPQVGRSFRCVCTGEAEAPPYGSREIQ